jgi:CubicO group peptidase (beta-lactamase class C family)
MRRIAMLAFGILLATTRVAPAAAGCGNLADLGDGWTTAAPMQEGLDPALICSIGPHLEGLNDDSPNGVVVVRHGVLVYEDYFTSNDVRWPEQNWREPPAKMPHDAGTKHDLQSITKSVVALLVGIALDQGALSRVAAPVLPFFPEYADLRTPEKDRITLGDLLTMRTGLDWPQKPFLGMARKMIAAADPYRLVLEQPLVTVPGLVWHYNNGSAELVGAVLHKATGRPLDDFARQTLFDPLGIKDWEWGRMANGDPGASWGLRLRPRDLAKIGQLLLNQGSWHGQQIVSAAWIKEMTEPHTSASMESYGYLWWLSRSLIEGTGVDMVEAIGWGGQRLYVVPSADLVVVVTAGAYDYSGQGVQDLAGLAALDMALRAAADIRGRWVSTPTPGHPEITIRREHAR